MGQELRTPANSTIPTLHHPTPLVSSFAPFHPSFRRPDGGVEQRPFGHGADHGAAVFGSGTYFSISRTAVGSKLEEGILPPGYGSLVMGSTGFLLEAEKSPARSAAACVRSPSTSDGIKPAEQCLAEAGLAGYRPPPPVTLAP